MAQEYISQDSEEIEERVNKKFSKEFSRTKSRILGALSKLDRFSWNPQVRTCSVVVPGTSRNNESENWEPTGCRPLKDPYPEAMLCPHHSGNPSGSGLVETHHMVTAVTEETRNRHHMTTGTQEENLFCFPGTSSGKRKKARSMSQPQFRSRNTPATFETDQVLLALQQLATNSNSANFNSNINRISKLPKSLTTTMPTFDGKSKRVELFDDRFQTSLKTHNQLTEEDKKLLSIFHAQ